MTPERAAFGPGLQIARERAGVTLEAIAASTKIKASLLAELERNDLSHWPQGIYRRAFFRDYLAAIGIASESLVAEFERLFSDDEPGISVSSPTLPAAEMRLTLAETPQTIKRATAASVAGAVLDVCLVFGLARVASWPIGLDFWAALAVVALAYFSVSAAFGLRTPGVRWLDGAHRPLRPAPVVPRAEVREPLRMVPSPAHPSRRPHPSDTLADEAPPTLHAVSG